MAQIAEVSALKLVFLGSDPIALPLLNWLAEKGRAHADLVAVFTQPDRPAGRGQLVAANDIKQWAQAQRLPVFQPEKIDETAGQNLASIRPDAVLVMAYGHILSETFIAIPRLGTLNLHTSLLPHYRGASPIQTAVACGEKTTGVTLMRIVRRLDAGPIADAESVAIGPTDTALEVEGRLGSACVPLLERCLPRLADGTLKFTEQRQDDATFCRKLVKADGALDFTRDATELAARINGLFPWPACSVAINGQAVKFGRADALPDVIAPEEAKRPATGEVIGADKEGLLIGTSRGVLRVHRLQRPGGQMLAAADFLRGYPVAPGLRLMSQPMPELVSRKPFRR